jgi:hypothetical protein
VDSESDVDCSRVSVDLEVQEWRERVTVLLCAMLFSSLQEHAASQAQHCRDYSQCCPSWEKGCLSSLSYNARFSRRQKGYKCAPCLKKHYEVPFVQGIQTIE